LFYARNVLKFLEGISVELWSVVLICFTVKVWADDWHLQLVFVGHAGPVTCLAVYPYGMHVLSAGVDQTMRVWSLETCDELEK